MIVLAFYLSTSGPSDMVKAWQGNLFASFLSMYQYLNIVQVPKMLPRRMPCPTLILRGPLYWCLLVAGKLYYIIN